MGKYNSFRSDYASERPGITQTSNRLKRVGLAATTLMLLAMVSGQDYRDLEIGDLSRNHRIESDETKFFRVKVPQREYDREKDLVIKVFSEGQIQGDPDVYISRNNKKPNRKENSEWMCSTYGKDTCTISGKEFRPDEYFYIGVRCGSTQDGQCTFSIQPSMTGELLLEDGVEQQLDFAQNEAKLFKFYIPANSVRSRDNEDYRVKSVVITAVPLLPIDEKMTLYASTKGSVTADQKSKRGTPGWRKGQTLRISEDDQGEWCTDCNVKILLDVTMKGKYQIMAKTNVGIVTLQEGVKFDDVSFYGERQCYKYFVKDSNTDVNVRFAQFSGISSLTFNPKQIPTKFEEAVYRKAEFGNAALVISPNDRKANASITGLYYLCVFSHMTATYSVQIIETPVSQPFHFLEDGWDEAGEVQAKSTSVYVYKVPPLDFKGEDISIEFQLASISGETPKMFGRFCKESKNGGAPKCGSQITNETIYAKNSGFLPAKAVGKGLSIIIDHDEDACQNLYNNECFYTIVVQGQGRKEGDISKFSITTMHSQQNYFVLQEGVAVSDYVSMGTYRYYSFTIPPPNPNELKAPKAKNVSFQLNSLHGDADIFVSRKHQYPNRMDYEKNSVKTSDSFDMIYFDDSNGKTDLTGTYYIGVYSYQYSTYSLMATVERIDINGKTVSFLGFNGEGKTGQSLIEGVSHRGSMHPKDSMVFRVDVKQLQGYEKAIKIQVSPLEGSFNIRASYGSEPGKESGTFKTDGHFLTITPKDKNFQREGILYIRVVPKANFLEQLDKKKNFQFLITYTTEDSYYYLKSQLPFEIKQAAAKDSFNYFRHFVGTFNKDISISMTVFSGSPVLYATFHPEQKWPQVASEDIQSTRNQAVMVSAAKGKALYFPSKLLQKTNPACSSALVDSQDPCVLFASVLCEPSSSDGKASKDDECRYALKLTYESQEPQSVIVGQPQHNVVKDGSFNYYYLVVRENTINDNQQIMAVLSSMKGNADLYVSFHQTPTESNPSSWQVPNQNDYVYKSIQTGYGNQDMIKIDAKNDKNLKDCFDRFSQRFGPDRECAIIFGVYSPATGKDSSQITDISQVDRYSSRYNFVVYMDLMELMSQAPVSGQVEKGEFQYYHFESTCVDCTIMISLSTVGSGDPDLFVNFGDDRLPTRENADMKSSTFKSEMITINLNHPFFKSNSIKSMKGPFVIGIYGVKRSNYTLVVSQEKYPIQLLMDNTALKASQEPFEIVYYAWYNMQNDNGAAKDFKLSLTVKNGLADIYLTTYIENENAKSSESQNMLAKLPKSKRDVQWIRENIDSKSGDTKKSLIVLNNERNYCTQCFYLIGIVTHDIKTDYSIQLDLLDANYKNAQILKLGEVYTASFKETDTDRTRVYRFILDEISPVQFIQTIKNAAISTKLSFSETGEPAILSVEDTSAVELSVEDKNFQLGKMYYLVVTERSYKMNATHSIMLMQNRTVVRLADGVPTRLKYHGKKDTSKLLIFSIPDGAYTFSVQVKSKTENFYPRLYVKYYEDLEASYRTLEFPPGGEPGYFICKQWDYKMGVLNYEEQFDNIKGGNAGLVLNLLEASSIRDSVQDGEAIITVSATPVIKMVEGNTYIGNLQHLSSYKIYQVDDAVSATNGFLMIEFTPCIGDTEFLIVENPHLGSNQIGSESKKFSDEVTQQKYGRSYKYIPLPRANIYILVRQKQYEEEHLRDEDGNEVDTTADFMIKVRHNQRMKIMNTEYYIPSDGKLFLNVMDTDKGVDLKWGHIYYSDHMGNVHYGEGVNYTVIATKDKRARLDTQCVMRKEVSSKYIMASFNTEQQNKFNFKMPIAGEHYYVNVIAKVQTVNEEEAELIPYKPIELYIPARSFMSRFVLLLFIVVCLAFLSGALYFYKKSKEVEHRIEYEMTDVRNVASVNSTYAKTIEMASIDRKEKQSTFAKVGEYESISVTGINDGVDESQYANNLPQRQL